MNTRSTPEQLSVETLRRTCDPATLGFETTADVAPSDSAIGQQRAQEAIAFGLAIPTPGYNLFATGPVGTGKRAALQAELTAHARERPDACDVVYVHNFDDLRRPLALQLPAGRGRAFADAIDHFVEDARRELVRAFESESHQRERRAITEALERDRDEALEELREIGRAHDIALELNPAGVLTIPLVKGKPVTREEFGRMPDAAQEHYQAALRAIEPEVREFLRKARNLERDARDQMQASDRRAGMFAIEHLVDALESEFGEAERLTAWLEALRDDMIDHLEELAGSSDDEAGGLPASLRQALGGDGGGPLNHYAVNVFVGNERGAGAPVIVETSPTYLSLFGRIEHQGVFGGGFVTDHRYLRAGALHRASGGYLMLPARAILAQPLLWERLKDVLQTGESRLENLGDQYALLPTPTLQPEPLALDVKVALYGPPPLYELAWHYDEDVRKLFRVKVEFEPRIKWTSDAEADYASYLSAEAGRADLLPLDASAVARIVEEGARLAGHHDWLTTRALEVAGLAAEATQRARAAGDTTVSAQHVAQALDDRKRRSNLTEQRLLDAVSDHTLELAVDGTRTGQLNGLAVIDLGDYAFGHPLRITATTGVGGGELISIEREVKLSGPIHDKGFLALRGYLEGHYGNARKLALAAQITFEQSYEEIEGDSASAAELFALLSDLSGLALRQDVAVTGSVNQHGQIQAIGGVNEKIEGFFHTCRTLGLTGSQGVLIPASNVQHLMLDPEVVDAVAHGQFHVWSAATIDDGLALLTGSDAESVHAGVRKRLGQMATAAARGPHAPGRTRERPHTKA